MYTYMYVYIYYECIVYVYNIYRERQTDIDIFQQDLGNCSEDDLILNLLR